MEGNKRENGEWIIFEEIVSRDFSGGPVVKNPPCNVEDVGLIPGQGTKIPHVAEQLSPHATNTELERLNYRACMPQTTEPTPPVCKPQLKKRKPPSHN